MKFSIEIEGELLIGIIIIFSIGSLIHLAATMHHEQTMFELRIQAPHVIGELSE